MACVVVCRGYFFLSPTCTGHGGVGVSNAFSLRTSNRYVSHASYYVRVVCRRSVLSPSVSNRTRHFFRIFSSLRDVRFFLQLYLWSFLRGVSVYKGPNVVTRFFHRVYDLVGASLPLLQPICKGQRSRVQLPFPRFFLHVSVRYSNVGVAMFSTSVMLVSNGESSRCIVVSGGASSLFVRVPIFLAISTMFPYFCKFSAFVASKVAGQAGFFLTFQASRPSLVYRCFLASQATSQMGGVDGRIRGPFRFRFLPLFCSLFYCPLCFYVSRVVKVGFSLLLFDRRVAIYGVVLRRLCSCPL